MPGQRVGGVDGESALFEASTDTSLFKRKNDGATCHGPITPCTQLIISVLN